jgi:predicted O-linked N-acetylglucosamine transferase (SPINDLY family)
MGRPVLTVTGSTLVGRQGSSIVSAIGHPEWAVADVDRLVAAAQALARDPQALARTQLALRDELRRSPLCDAAAFTRRLEALYERLLRVREEETKHLA